MTATHTIAMESQADIGKRARRTKVLALVHLGLALAILAGFVFTRVHSG